MNETQRGWLAGIIDGEGCITIGVQKPGSYGRLSPSHRLFLKVTMGHKPTVDLCRELTGFGSIHLQRHFRYNDAWSWWVGGRQAAEVIRLVLDLLVTKRAEADVALEFDGLPRGLVGGAHGNARLSSEMVAARQDCFERIRDLKPSSRFRKVQ